MRLPSHSFQKDSPTHVQNLTAILILIACTASISAVLLHDLVRESVRSRLDSDTVFSMEFRQLAVKNPLFTQHTKDRTEQTLNQDVLSDLSVGEIAAIDMLETDFGRKDTNKPLTSDELRAKKRFWEQHPDWISYVEACRAVWDDVSCFPVAKITGPSKHKISFEDSWMYERTYGGDRFHEGTDLFPPKNKPGLYPVVSMTDGIVAQKGWLKLGGFRIGILSPNGAYFYYAHLDSYADLDVGDPVLAGQFLGYMGDTGYSEKEGTRGNFPVHLHVGIYLLIDGKEISVNPYPVLCYVSKSGLF